MWMADATRKSTKNRKNYGDFEEREKGFELWQGLEKP